MSDRVRCSCRRCVIRSLAGPAVVVTIGVLFLLGEVRGGYFDFWTTWPVILIVLGAVSLASALAPTDGHIASPVPPAPSGTAPPPPNPYAGPGQGR
jgi:cell wall-active antibiotic response 4TMS protein YvqF